MERGRKTKVIAIVALIVAIVGMSLGFAAFSNILTISSSATVTPNKSDFKIKAYGTTQEIYDLLDLSNDANHIAFSNLSLYDSDTISIAQINNETTVGKDAVIANGGEGNINISNLNASFTTGGLVFYAFAIKNEGMYDAYVNFSDFQNMIDDNGDIKKTCTPGEGTTPSLVEEACKGIELILGPINSSGTFFPEVPGFSMTSSYKLKQNDYIILVFIINYSTLDVKADGPFFVEFADLELHFTTVANGEILNP